MRFWVLFKCSNFIFLNNFFINFFNEKCKKILIINKFFKRLFLYFSYFIFFILKNMRGFFEFFNVFKGTIENFIFLGWKFFIFYLNYLSLIGFLYFNIFKKRKFFEMDRCKFFAIFNVNNVYFNCWFYGMSKLWFANKLNFLNSVWLSWC